MKELKRWREAKGFTQEQLAEKMGYSSAQFISNIERGVAALPATSFKKVSNLLGIPLDELINQKLKHTETVLRRQAKRG